MSETERETLEGVVAGIPVKDGVRTGLTLKGRDGYLNFTKQEWRQTPWDDFEKGDTVKLALNKGWIYAIKRVSNGATPGDREGHIAKSVALKAAVDYYATREGSGPDVVTMAEFFYEGFLAATESAPPSGPAFGDDGDPGPSNPFE